MVNIKNISYTYKHSSKAVLNNVSFDIEAGQVAAVLGNNGAGKSTLLKCIDRIHHSDGAEVLINGNNIFKMNNRAMAQNVAYVPQTSEAINMTVFDAVLLGRKPYIKWDSSSEDREIVSNIIEKMGLGELMLRNVSELSGGEVQKVMLARALAQQPELLLLDEPTSNLDPYNQHEVLRTVSEIARENSISVIIIIHDLNLAVRYCNRFLFLKDSTVYSYGDISSVDVNTIKTVYGIEVDILEHNGVKIIAPK